ncbi:anthranilate phosphoribosyltransferase [Ornithinicoccus halotolerans]|uniref:anthranilate phosphoribosyltransferase n=1 Tax=Ornithinicoccus halotolerans TaxID=1748220 RepID=UPI00129511AB|nr:anthranilate phosphoribosyltransferase [Ornithinicoccus halotolerans]
MTDASATTWPDVLSRLLAGTDLSTEDAGWAMDQVMSGLATPVQIAGFLTALRAKGETVQEMRGLADTMLAHARRFQVEGPALDIVGTGGDRAHTVNISTMSSVVAAGAGVRVVKHGNRAASSSSGSADVLEALGLRLDLEPVRVEQVLHDVGLTFCFAQTFHPSMRHAGSVRRELGVPTVFNFLGPLTNPGQPRYAAVGVADPRMAPLIAGVFAGRGRTAVVFRGDDGLDEITPSTTSRLWWTHGGELVTAEVDPARVGIGPYPLSALRGADAAHNAQVARRLLDGETGPVREAVLLNTGLALALVQAGEADEVPSGSEDLHRRLGEGIERAADAIDSGAAASVLQRWGRATAG